MSEASTGADTFIVNYVLSYHATVQNFDDDLGGLQDDANEDRTQDLLCQ